MMKKIILLISVIILPAAVFSLDISVPESVEQGGVITVVLKDGDGVKAEFGRGGTVYSESESFKTKVDDHTASIALLGVPSTLSPGIYYVSAGDGEVRKSIRVESKDFFKEDIELNKSMSNLRQSDDEEKAEQWRSLLIILKTVETEDVFETGLLEKPVEELWTSSHFGDIRRYLYSDGTTAGSVHAGIDYSAEPGTPVYAPGDGKVVFAAERILTGFTVVIEHLPGVYSLYYHLSKIDAEEGALIHEGDSVGKVGATGLVTGAHLHWEVRVAGVAVDPVPLMTGGLIDKAYILGIIEKQ